MLEALIWDELYQQIPKQFEYNGDIVNVKVYRANQVLKDISFPIVFVSFLDPVIDKTSTPLNKVVQVLLNQDGDIEYTRSVTIRQSIDLNIYDDDIRRIAQLQNYLWLWARKDLKFSNVQVLQVTPPRNLDFTEEEYIYRRTIEIICRFSMTWQEMVQTVEQIETSLDVQS